MKNNRCCVGRRNRLYQSERSSFDRSHARIHDGIERVFHVRRCKHSSVVKFHPGSQMKNISYRVGSFPRLGQVAVRNSLRIEFHQAIKNKSVNSFRRPIRPDPRIQIRRHRFDQKIDDARFGRNRACTGRKREKEGSKGNKGNKGKPPPQRTIRCTRLRSSTSFTSCASFTSSLTLHNTPCPTPRPSSLRSLPAHSRFAVAASPIQARQMQTLPSHRRARQTHRMFADEFPATRPPSAPLSADCAPRPLKQLVPKRQLAPVQTDEQHRQSKAQSI